MGAMGTDAEGRLRMAFDVLEQGVVVVDESGREILVNRVMEGYRSARDSAVLAEQEVAACCSRALQGERPERDLDLFGPPRQVLSIQAFPLIRADGSIVGAAAFVRDVTDARRIEHVRRDFVANVSHELKTPIGALGLLAETMAADSDPAVTKQLAERVLHEADRLSRIVDDLLDLSIIESQETHTRASVSIGGVIEESVDRVAFSAEAAGTHLDVSPVDHDLRVSGDRGQLVSAITNLLENATKYSDPGSSVSITVTRDGEWAVISVRDHGVGIPSRDLERIFERFYRVDRARSRATGGTGLGLAIVRHVALNHGGDVEVESTEGEGSTFRLRLPLALDTGEAP